MTAYASVPSPTRSESASPSRSHSGRESARSRRGTGPAARDASARDRSGVPAAVRSEGSIVGRRVDGVDRVARRDSSPGLATACAGSRSAVSSTRASARSPSARTMTPRAGAGLVDDTTSNLPASSADSAATPAGSSLQIGPATAAGGAGCGATAGGDGCTGCSTRWAGGAGCVSAGAAGAGGGVGTTPFGRSGRNAIGST